MRKTRLILAFFLAPPFALLSVGLVSALFRGFRDFRWGGAGYVLVTGMLVGGFFLYLAECLLGFPAYLAFRSRGWLPVLAAAAAGATTALILSTAVLLFGTSRDRGHWEWLPVLVLGGAAGGFFFWALGLSRPDTSHEAVVELK